MPARPESPRAHHSAISVAFGACTPHPNVYYRIVETPQDTYQRAGAGIIASPPLRLVYDYWLERRHGRFAPTRADIDPLELPRNLLQFLVVTEAVEGGKRFRYRLAGGVSRQANGRELTGGFVDEVLPQRGGYAAFVVGLYRDLVALRLPVYSETRFFLEPGLPPRDAFRLMLPLSSDGTTVDMIFAAQIFALDPLDGFARPLGDFQRFEHGRIAAIEPGDD